MHPLRLQYEFFSDANPAMAPIGALAEQIRKDRTSLAADNLFLALQEGASRQIVAALDAWRDLAEATAERAFLSIYGSPTLQAALGIDSSPQRARKAAKSPLHDELLRKRIAELKSRIPVGGAREAVVRGLIYVGMPRGAVDERGFELARRIREANGGLALADFKALVREQFNMLVLDQEAALAAIPKMLPADAEARRGAYDLIRVVLAARGPMTPEDNKRLADIARLFDVEDDRTARPPWQAARPDLEARAS